jgi:hypothetical protein
VEDQSRNACICGLWAQAARQNLAILKQADKRLSPKWYIISRNNQRFKPDTSGSRIA